MTKEEILEGNLLIAKFTNIQVTEFTWKDHKCLIVGNEDDAMDYGNLTYYTPDIDWNQLIPVVGKISKIPSNYYPDGMYKYMVDVELNPITGITIKTNSDKSFYLEEYENDFIANVFKGVIGFIKWYDIQTNAIK